MAERHPADDAQRHPERQKTFKKCSWAYATSGRDIAPPSPRPMSRSLMPSDNLSMLWSGRLVKANDPVLQIAERRDERGFLRDVGAFDRGRVLNAPMRRHRLARPQRAGSPAALSQP